MKILSHETGKWKIQTTEGEWIISAFYFADHYLSISIGGSQEIWNSICEMNEESFTNFILGCI